MRAMAEPFWKTKTLEEMSAAEWNHSATAAANAALSKLEDEDQRNLFHQRRLAGCSTRKPAAARTMRTAGAGFDCVRLTPENVRTITWLPSTCAYRLVAEGRDLYSWHPLISGDKNSVRKAAHPCVAASPLPRRICRNRKI